jgi:hypothetical protein
MLSALVTHSLYAGELCPGVKQSGTWSIPESAFTREEANKALRALEFQVNKRWEGAGWLNIENHLKMVKGYLFKVHLNGYRKKFGEDDAILKDEFCKFLENDGHIEH